MHSTAPRRSWIAQLTGSAWFWIVVVVLVAGLSIGRALFRRLPPMLPALGEVPAFSLVDQTGAPFGSRDLLGRTWVAAAVSPSDPKADLIGEKLRQIQHRSHNLGADFHVVSITPDPERDAPPDLDAFVRKEHGSPRMWTFLTGDKKDVMDLLARFQGLGDVSHPCFVLVDRTLQARAVYDALDSDVVERVLFDVGLLVNRGG